MGFMSNQWLNTGQGLRNRSYWPKKVKVKALKGNDQWSVKNDIKVKIIATKEDYEYQILHLTAPEADIVTPIIWSACSPQLRSELALQVLAELNDKELLRLLAKDLKHRLKDAKEN